MSSECEEAAELFAYFVVRPRMELSYGTVKALINLSRERVDFSLIPQVLALAGAYALSFPIGWDREREARSAGLRTFPLVAVASCGFIQASEMMIATSPDATARVVQGVITGVGFIGGGAILKHENFVHGTATAASIWATGAIGTAVALGSYDVAIVISIFTFLTLRLLTLFKN